MRMPAAAPGFISQALVADELHAEGRMAEAISLLTAVTRHYE